MDHSGRDKSIEPMRVSGGVGVGEANDAIGAGHSAAEVQFKLTLPGAVPAIPICAHLGYLWAPPSVFKS